MENSKNAIVNDRILGCLLGGAAGDALGYAVEFMGYDSIVQKYGPRGVTACSVDPVSGKALISDDTQMTLFTAEGLLQPTGDRVENVWRSYRNWLITQTVSFEKRPGGSDSALLQRPELFSLRAPGSTCMSALMSGRMGTPESPLNASKGCGGVMRAAPVAFLTGYSPLELDELAQRTAAITHGHPLGYLSAALLVHILHKLIFDEGGRPLPDTVRESVREFSRLFSAAPGLDALLALVGEAIERSGNALGDVENIRQLGEGWVGDEALAIALYCAVRYPSDFSSALIAAVNHDGDSDSTGAVAGNLIGASLGASAIRAEWKERMELYDLIEHTAEQFYV